MSNTKESSGAIRRAWQFLTAPSVRWSVLALLLTGAAAGAAAIVSTQVVVHATGTNEFCGGACHSMQWVNTEYLKSSHGANRRGVVAACSDCHIPHQYPDLLFYKAAAGIKDAYHEMRGTISTEEKFKQHRKRMAESVWAEFRANDSANCRTCHVFTPDVLALQKGGARKEHEGRFAEKKTCIDCHAGAAHEEPES